MVGWTRHRIRAAMAATVSGLLLLAGTACGTAEFTYVTNSQDRTYVKIPSSWRPVDPEQLNNAFGLDPAVAPADVGIWHTAYDADPVPTTAHIIGWGATAPVALIGVRQIPPTQRGSLSLDELRDMFLPVSPSARQQLGLDPTQAGRLTDFALMTDDVLTPGDGLRGVHTVFRYRSGNAAPQIIDQTAYLNDDASKVFMLFVRCSTQCYMDRQQEITSVVSSFTVRGKP